MKNTRKNPLFLLLAFTAAALTTFTSCKKDPEEIAALLSESEASEIAETAISDRTAGATTPTVDVAKMIESNLGNCGIPGDTSFQKSKSGAVSYDYQYDLTWIIHCNNLNIPQNATATVQGNGSFGTARWDGGTQSNGSLTFTGLRLSDPEYIANGSYAITGDVTGDFRKVDPTLNCTTEITLTNLKISKSTYKITGGSGVLKITATDGKGRTETINGTLVFNGDGTVTVTINGHSHTF